MKIVNGNRIHCSSQKESMKVASILINYRISFKAEVVSALEYFFEIINISSSVSNYAYRNGLIPISVIMNWVINAMEED